MPTMQLSPCPQRSLLPLRPPTATLHPSRLSGSGPSRTGSGCAARANSVRTRASVDDDSSNPFRSPASSPSSQTQQPAAPPPRNAPQQQPTASTSTSAPTSAPPRPANDARVESLEAAIRSGRRGTGQRRTIPIRGVDPPAAQVSEEFAPWKEGQLWPEGWENMSSAEKARELYMGQRGVLFWINKLAYGAAIAMLGGWVFFRLIGPNLGLYKLAGDMMPPTL